MRPAPRSSLPEHPAKSLHQRYCVTGAASREASRVCAGSVTPGLALCVKCRGGTTGGEDEEAGS